MSNLDLAALRKTVTAMRLRVATVQQRDAFNRAAKVKSIAAGHRASAAALTAKLGRMPRYPRRERREAERALAKAEKRAVRA